MKKILAIGAHYDDIELGCGGTLMNHVFNGDKVMLAVTNSDDHLAGSPELRFKEQQSSNLVSGFTTYIFGSDDAEEDIVKTLDDLEPDIVFSMFEKDTHQHHVRSAGIGASVGRKYRITSYIFDSGSAYDFHPNVFNIINFSKKERLLECFASQIERGTIKIDRIKRKEAYWASLVSPDADYAEAFLVRKLRYRY